MFQTAQKVGFANCRCGCENDLIRLGKISCFEVGKLGDPITKYTPEMAKNMAEQEKLLRYQKRAAKKEERARRNARKRENKKRHS